MKKDLKPKYWQDPNIIEKLKNLIKIDKIIINSTDTILGLTGNLSQKSFDCLNEIKEERVDKPYLLLVYPQDKIYNFVDKTNLTPQILNLIKNLWPGPLTIIFKAKKNLPNFLKSKENKIGIRCPNHKKLQSLLNNFDGLFSTSANKSGKKPATHISELDIDLINKVSEIVVDINERLDQNLPSTIIDVCNPNEIKIVREGILNIKDLEKYYGAKIKK